MKVLEAMKSGYQLLKEKKVSSYMLDSEVLLSKTLKKTREEIMINLEQNLSDKEVLIFNEYLVRRSRNEPIAYILKEKEFWSKKFYVNKNTLIPRPETELLVDKLANIYRNKRITLLDIGTGSGCIILSLLSELKDSSGIAVDISNKTIPVLKMRYQALIE